MSGERPAHRMRYPVVGVPVRFETNAASVADAIETSFGEWRGVAAPSRAEVKLRVSIFVEPRWRADASRADLRYRLPRVGEMLISSGACMAHVSAATREAVAYVAPGFVEDAEHFRYAVLEALTFFLVSFQDRAPFHAAALRRGSAALLLTGPSGMGKSTLAYAASRRGARLFAEDYVWIQQRPRFRVWGRSRGFHLPAESARFFPELAGTPPAIVANGKAKIAVPVPPPGRAELPWVDRATVCVLKRSTGAPRLRRITARSAERLLAAEMTAGFDIFADVVPSIVRHCGGAWQLSLSRDPGQVMPLVERLLEELDEGGATPRRTASRRRGPAARRGP